MQTLIIGIGNTLFSDDGAGIYALNFLRNFHSDVPGAKFVNGEIFEPHFTDEIIPTDNLIVIDATDLNSEPGSIHVFMGDEMDNYLDRGSKNGSHHSLQKRELADLINEIHLVDIPSQRRALIGIQPLCLDQGDCLSTTVEEAIPNVCCRVLNLIEKWH